MASAIIVPKLRFPGFHGAWQIRILNEIATFSKGRNISKLDISANGRVEAIRYGELYTIYGETISKVISKTDLDSSYLVLSRANDVIIPASGETNIDIATASCVLRSDIALSGDINIIRSGESGVFLAYYFNSWKKYDIARMAQGVSVVHLYGSSLKTLRLNLPHLAEQKKIAQFLTLIDERISTTDKKIALLKQYQKAVMQKIFTQQIRFKDEKDRVFPDWESKQLGDIANHVTVKNRNNAISFVLTNSASDGIVSQIDYFEKDIANKDNLSDYFVVAVDDFVYNPRISSLAPVGPIKRNHIARGVMSPLYSVFNIVEGSRDFFEHYFETSNWHEYMKNVSNSGARHDRMNIASSDLYKMPVPFPTIMEQDRIADYLTALDSKVRATETLLTCAKAFKKALLQRLLI